MKLDQENKQVKKGIDNKESAQPLLKRIKRKKSGFAGNTSKFCFSENFVFLVAVIIIVLSMSVALIVYFSDPQSAHKEGLQKTLVETLTMACMLGVGTIFGLLGAVAFRKRD